MLFRPSAIVPSEEHAQRLSDLRHMRKLSEDQAKEAGRKFIDTLFDGVLDDISRSPPGGGGRAN